MHQPCVWMLLVVLWLTEMCFGVGAGSGVCQPRIWDCGTSWVSLLVTKMCLGMGVGSGMRQPRIWDRGTSWVSLLVTETCLAGARLWDVFGSGAGSGLAFGIEGCCGSLEALALVERREKCTTYLGWCTGEQYMTGPRESTNLNLNFTKIGHVLSLAGDSVAVLSIDDCRLAGYDTFPQHNRLTTCLNVRNNLARKSPINNKALTAGNCQVWLTGVCHRCQPCSAVVLAHQQHQGRCSATSRSLFHTASSSIPSFPTLSPHFFCTTCTGSTIRHLLCLQFIVYSFP